MLESEESSSSSSTVTTSNVNNVLPQISHNHDENLNEDPSKLHPDLKQQQQQRYCKELTDSKFIDDVGNEASNTNHVNNFIDPNDTLVPSQSALASLPSYNYKTGGDGSRSIEVYVDNTNKIHERIYKKINGSKGRSPLAIVACNNNYNNVNNSNNNEVLTNINDDLHHSIKRQTVCPHPPPPPLPLGFFLFRNPVQKPHCDGKDHFKRLSDEMILQIFKWLPKKTLMRCNHVCRRFNQLAQDESLWTRLDLGGKILKSGALGKIVARGVVILRLAQAEISHPVFDPDSIENSLEFQTKLQYLDLSMAIITKPSLKMLLSKCRQLKKLSLEHVKLNDEICCEIAKNTHLEALNLAMCAGLETWSIKKLMSELQELHSLNISWTTLSVESVKAVVDNVTPNLLRLNIAGCRKSMFDSHLATLSERCPGLLELDLSDCTALTSAATDLICNFNDLEYLSLSRCYNISATAYMNLGNLTALSYLDVFGLLSDSALTVLQNTFPTVGINKFIYSSVARPTVGTRRTSIWGLRTRD